MINFVTASLCKNYVGTIDMLQNLLELCPEELLKKDKRFFYIAYHSIIFLDYYLSNPVKDFRPKLPYSIHHADSLPTEAVDDVLPDHFYTKEQLLNALHEIRVKCKELFSRITDDKLSQRWILDEETDMHGLCPPLVAHYTRLEILLYNLRHLQHHTGQLNLLLRQEENLAADWVSQSPCS